MLSTRRRLLPARIVPVLAVPVLVAALAGCSSGGGTGSATPSAAASGSTSAARAPIACTDPGAASDAVAVSGEVGEEPEVTFDAPLKADRTETTVLERGDGAEVQVGDLATVALVAYNGTTGEPLPATKYEDLLVTVNENTLRGLASSLDCATAGSRVAAVVPPADALGTSANSQLGLDGTESLVIVADVTAVAGTKADGEAKALPKDFPTIELAADGAPTVTIPDADQPNELKIAESKTGTGKVVEESDQVAVQYQGVLWRTGDVFDQSWGKQVATFSPSGVVPGFSKALVGHKVGSQVVAIVPPAEGYGETGSEGAGIRGDDVMVFVVDILAAA